MAILFFVFTFAASFAVIWELYKDNRESNSVNGTSDTTSSTDSSTSSSSNASGSKLSGFTPVSDVTKLQTTDIKVGTGQTVQSGDTITADYTGAVAATGVIFQSSSSPVSFSLSQVIEGWTLGIPGMKVGGTRQLLIPASEAYGANPPSGSGIPANAALVFNVTVESIGSN